jgi:flagellar biosynthetic protein FlhB
MGGAALVLMIFSGGMSRDLTTTMRGLIANSWQIHVDGPALPHLFKVLSGELLAVLAIPFLLLMAGGAVRQPRSAPAGVDAGRDHPEAL